MQSTRKCKCIHVVTVFTGQCYDSMEKPSVVANHSMLEELSKCFSGVDNIEIC